MSKEKRYYWLKLKEDWFGGSIEKYLKSLPAGDSLLIAYLKIQLLSLKTEGFLKYERLLPSAEEEIAMLIDEPINNVRILINVLLKTGEAEKLDDNSLYLLSLQKLIGSEGSSAQRVRDFRDRKKQELLHCNSNVTKPMLQECYNVTPSNIENIENTEIEASTLHCNGHVTNVLRRERVKSRERDR